MFGGRRSAPEITRGSLQQRPQALLQYQNGGYPVVDAGGRYQGATPSSPSALVSSRKAAPQLHESAYIDRVTHLLQGRDALKAIVVECFRAAAGGEESLDIGGLYSFKSVFASRAGVPEALFKDLHVDYIRFDFRGSGRLSVNETYKLVKFYLFAYLRASPGLVHAQVARYVTSLEAEGYRIIKQVGKGAQGTVHFAISRDGKEKCIKSYKKEVVSVSGLTELKEEFEAMRLLACDRIAEAFEIFQDFQFYYMVGEAYHGGDFQTLKERARKQGVIPDERWWKDVFRQCFEGIVFMHEQAMMHCDIKEPNLMLRSSNFVEPEVVIIDLGLSKAMVGKNKIGGTPGYMPPETHDRKMWFPKGDVFSMGVCIVQILADKIPPTGARTVATPGGIFVEGCRTVEDIANATRSRQPPFHLMPPEMPDLVKLAQRLLQKQMQLRPNAHQALEDPWFRSEQAGALDASWSPGKRGLSNAVAARNRFATDGITPSVLVQIEENGASPAA